MRKASLYFLMFCTFFLNYSSVIAQQIKNAKHAPRRVIFDTDFGPDYDDVGAISLLYAFADSGYANILATMASCKHKNVAAALSVFNTYFNRPEIPIGVVRGNALSQGDWQHWTDSVIANFPHAIQSNEQAIDALELYRKILASQPDASVTIITVGFLTNLFNLLQSPPDKYSPLNGWALVQKKVKQLVSMAGRFPEGREFNVDQDSKASVFVFEHWPTPVLFSGFEIGQPIKTGLDVIQNEAIQHSPVKDAFRIAIPMSKEDAEGRSSWDETAVWVAIKGVQPYYSLKKGRIVCLPDGSNKWNHYAKGHAYLVEKMPAEQMAHFINQWIMYQPRQSIQ